MLLKKMAGKNYFVASLILFGLIVLSVIAVFVVTAFIPDALGQSPQEYVISSVFEFEPWQFRIDAISVSFPEGGIICTVQETSYDRTMMLIGRGSMRHKNDVYNQNNALGIFMTVKHDIFDEIRGDNIFVPVEDRSQLEMVSTVFNKQVGKPTIWHDKIPISFHIPKELSYFYFIAVDGEPILPPVAKYSTLSISGSAIIYSLFVILMLLVMTLFTLDHRYSQYWVHLARTHPGYLGLVLVPITAGLFTAGKITPELNNWPGHYAFIGYGAGILLLIILHKRGQVDYLDFGLRRDKLKNGYMLAILSSALILTATRGLPAGIEIVDQVKLIQLLLIFLLLALPIEMIWRGYIQAYLTRLTGPNWGLLIMITLVGLSQFAFIYITEPWMLYYPYTHLEIAILAPGTAAILGYLYLRTENILACALLHSCIIYLPDIILY